MVFVDKTFSKTRKVFNAAIAFVMIAAGFAAILLSSSEEKVSFVSLVTGAQTAHADYMGGDASTDGVTDAANDGCGPDGDASGDGGDGE